MSDAQTLYEAFDVVWRLRGEDDNLPWDELISEDRNVWKRMARSAIEALRRPVAERGHYIWQRRMGYRTSEERWSALGETGQKDWNKLAELMALIKENERG